MNETEMPLFEGETLAESARAEAAWPVGPSEHVGHTMTVLGAVSRNGHILTISIVECSCGQRLRMANGTIERALDRAKKGDFGTPLAEDYQHGMKVTATGDLTARRVTVVIPLDADSGDDIARDFVHHILLRAGVKVLSVNVGAEPGPAMA